MARDAEKIGVDGLMVLPAMVYKSNPRETLHHFRTRGARHRACPSWSTTIPCPTASTSRRRCSASSRTSPTSSPSRNPPKTRAASPTCGVRCGDRFVLFGGVDDIVLECLMLGATRLGLGADQRFPARVGGAVRAGQCRTLSPRRCAIYRWFMPLLQLDTIPTLVQCIKLAEQLMGRGSEMVRAPRLCLEGAERALGRGPGA